ncbi:hypothetical protein P9D43_09605 [Neobacillus niacini]|uniref:hypothetical protein n=1 Tax=Neobacillus niacini TaxID=86668 RepID=UPI00068FDA16|nr:hypothetical protein [Neobacillus niacini]MEC1522272.1 hypothetical protein [Neobacillus niacini]
MTYTYIDENLQCIASLQRDLNLVTAFLLLTGQITVIGVFITSGGFRVSLSGPILGGERTVGKYEDKISNAVIDIIDLVLAILLIVDQIRLTGVVLGPRRFSVNVSGPIFGVPLYEPALPVLRQDYHFFQQIVSSHFNIDSSIFKNIEKE